MNISNFSYHSSYEDEENGTVTHYFISPKKVSKNRIVRNPDIATAISIEVGCYGEIFESEASPVGINGPYDWRDIDLSYEDVEKLFSKVKNGVYCAAC